MSDDLGEIVSRQLPWWIDAEALIRDTQEDFPPPLRRPGSPPVRPGDSSQVSGSRKSSTPTPQEPE